MAVVGGVPFQDLEMRKAPPLWRRAVDPLINVPSAAERHRQEGAEAFFRGIAPRDPTGPRPQQITSAGGALAGGAQWLFSPLSGAIESLWDKPASENLQTAGVPKEYADPIASTAGLALPGIGFGGVLAKASKLDKVLDPKLWKGFTTAQRGRTGAASQIAGGDNVFVRLNLNVAPKKSGTTLTDYMLTFHRGRKDGRPDYESAIAYDQGAALKNVFFDIDQPSRILIAGRESTKTPIASVGGKFRSVSYKTMEKEMKNAEVVASFNPAKGNFFTDIKTGAPIKSADKAVLVGDKVYLRGNVKYHDRSKLTVAEEGGILKTDFPINWERETSAVIARSKAGPYESELFDLSRYGDVPAQAQVPIQRVKLTDFQQEKWDKLITPANIKQTIKHVDEGLAKGGFEWYDLEPLRYRFLEELGPKAGNQKFMEYVQMVAGTSPGSKVPINIRRAAYFYHLLQNSKNPTAAIAKWQQGVPKGLGHQYHRVQHTPALQKTFDHPFNYGLLTNQAGMAQPKMSSFGHNLMGNWQPATVDMHVNRMLTGGKEMGSPPPAAYAHPEQVMKGVAEEVGVTPAQAQASGWVDFMQGESRPFLILFEEAVKKTADKLNKTPDQVLKLWMNGKVPLASVLPMGATQLGTELADDIFGEKLIG